MAIRKVIREINRVTLIFLEQSAIYILAVLDGDLCVREHISLPKTLTSLPGQPIQVNDMVFLHPERAETKPPEDIYPSA